MTTSNLLLIKVKRHALKIYLYIIALTILRFVRNIINNLNRTLTISKDN